MFFEYFELPEDINIKFVAYRLKRRVSVWWGRLREMKNERGVWFGSNMV